MLKYPQGHSGRQWQLSLLLCNAQKLLPHRTLGEIRDCRNANLKKRKATEKPRQKPQQPLERLTSKGSGTFVRRPSLQQKHSATKSLQLVPSDDLFQDSLWGSSAEPQKLKAKPAAEAKDLAAHPGKLTARKSFSAAPPQQSMPSAHQAAAKKLLQPEQQAQHSGTDALPNSIVREVSRAAAAFRKQGVQTISREASVNESEAAMGSAVETAPPQSASLELQPFGTPLLRQHRDLRAEIPDWSLSTQRPHIKVEERDQRTEPALRSQADLVQQPVTTAQPPRQQQEYTQQQGALSEVEILGQSAERKRQPEARKELVSEAPQKPAPLQQQRESSGGQVPSAAEQTQASDIDTELAADPLFDHYEAMQQDSAADALPASTLHSAASAKPEEATQPHSAPGWTHQAASPLPVLVGAYPVLTACSHPSILPWPKPVVFLGHDPGYTTHAVISLSYSQRCCTVTHNPSPTPKPQALRILGSQPSLDIVLHAGGTKGSQESSGSCTEPARRQAAFSAPPSEASQGRQRRRQA